MIHRVIRKVRIQGAVVVLILAVPIAIPLRLLVIHADGWCSGFALMVVALLAITALAATIWPQVHPLMQMLKPYGEGGGGATKIDAELAGPDAGGIEPGTRWG